MDPLLPVVRLFGLFGHSQKPIRSNSNLALFGKIDLFILSIRKNWFMFLHSEVLRYSSSALTIHPLHGRTQPSGRGGGGGSNFVNR